MMPFLEGARLLQPTLFFAGKADAVIEFWKDEFDAMEVNVPSLWKKIVLPGAGNWIQQARPNEVNHLMIDFLRSRQ
jgi:hypothetical protein